MPVKLQIPHGSLLDPSPSAAVVGGSVLTTQRIVDVVLKAFGVCAASQVLKIGCFDGFELDKVDIQHYPSSLPGEKIFEGSSGISKDLCGNLFISWIVMFEDLCRSLGSLNFLPRIF